jgi:hypothetical protein
MQPDCQPSLADGQLEKNLLLWLAEYEAQVQGDEDGNNEIKYIFASYVLTKDSF